MCIVTETLNYNIIYLGTLYVQHRWSEVASGVIPLEFLGLTGHESEGVEQAGGGSEGCTAAAGGGDGAAVGGGEEEGTTAHLQGCRDAGMKKQHITGMEQCDTVIW